MYRGDFLFSSCRRARRLSFSAGVLMLVAASAAISADYMVNTTLDINSGQCTQAQCSLRDALIVANGSHDPSRILLPAGTYFISIPGSGENEGMLGDFDIKSDITFVGAGPKLTRLGTQFPGEQIIDVAAGARLRIEGIAIDTLVRSGSFGDGDVAQTRLEISNAIVGKSNMPGYTIDAKGVLVIMDSTIIGSNFSPGQRTILFTGSSLNISGSTVSWKVRGIDAQIDAGGLADFSNVIINLGGPFSGFAPTPDSNTELCPALNISGGGRITINHSQIYGGISAIATSCLQAESIAIKESSFVRLESGYKALSVSGPATDIRNTTVVGSISNSGQLTLSATTVGGESDYAGQGSYSLENLSGGTIHVSNSVLIAPCSGGGVIASGNNVEAPGDTCGLPAETSRVNQPVASLELGPLDFNGSTTLNYLPGPTSALVKVFTPKGVAACLPTDQRGFVRAPVCTIGSVEYGASEPIVFRDAFE